MVQVGRILSNQHLCSRANPGSRHLQVQDQALNKRLLKRRTGQGRVVSSHLRKTSRTVAARKASKTAGATRVTQRALSLPLVAQTTVVEVIPATS